MKINPSDGAISFASGTIRRGDEKELFLGTSIGSAAKVALVSEDSVHLDIRPEDGIACTLLYKGSRLDRIFILMAIPSDESDQWSEELELQRKSMHNSWLRSELGEPPYKYRWGSVSSEYDPKGCVSEIIVTYAE